MTKLRFENVVLYIVLRIRVIFPSLFFFSQNSVMTRSNIFVSLCIKHPNLFGGSEKLDVSWDKGLYDSNILVAFRRPRPEWLAQQSFVIQVYNLL